MGSKPKTPKPGPPPAYTPVRAQFETAVGPVGNRELILVGTQSAGLAPRPNKKKRALIGGDV